ncbi:MAG: hypothetical protein ACRDT4_11000 [Micromonosporaceae bacterium]
MDYRELFAAVRRRPRMYLPDETYASAVAFVSGCQASTGGLLLEGFREWLQVRVGRIASLTFDGLAGELARSDSDADRIAALFDALDAFLAERDSHGLEKTFDAYLELLRAEGLYESRKQRWSAE